MYGGSDFLEFDITWTITAIIAVSSFFSSIAVAVINNHHHAKMRKMELDYDQRIKELDLKQQVIIRQADIYYADKKRAYSEVLKCAGNFSFQKQNTESYGILHSAIDNAILFCSSNTRNSLDSFLSKVNAKFLGGNLSEPELLEYSNEVSLLAVALSHDLESTKPVMDCEYRKC